MASALPAGVLQGDVPDQSKAIDGSVDVRIDFFRPDPDLDYGLANHQLHRCEYEIVYGGKVIHAYQESGMDGVDALLRAMRDAANRFSIQYFNKIDADKKYRDIIPYIHAVPPEWLQDMRIAGTEPTWIADEPVIFQHADGRRTPGRIALGYPLPGAGPYMASCSALFDGLDEGRGVTLEADTPFQALQLATASLATRLRAFLAAGGHVLTPAGDADMDLMAMFGPLLAGQDAMRERAQDALRHDGE